MPYSTSRPALALAFALALAAPAAARPDDDTSFLDKARDFFSWNDPAEPAKIIGPVHFVGTKGLGSYLLRGSKGHVLIYSGMPGSGPMIEKSIRKLGLDPKDVKLILTGHAHVDHVGGHAHLVKATGARVAVMREEQELLQSGGKLDFQYAHVGAFAFDPVKASSIFRDGDTIELGDLSLVARLTPGHTRGCTTYTTTVTHDGKSYSVAFPDGTGVNPGYRLGRRPSYPGIADDYRRTFRTLASLKPDVWLTPHNVDCGFDDKLRRSAKEGVSAWVDPKGYRDYVARRRKAFEEAADDAAAARQLAYPVTVQNFTRAESDLYFGRVVAQVGVGKIGGTRTFVPIDKQTVVRMNRDTLYASGVFDLDAAPLTLALPDAGKRFLSMQVIDQDHYTLGVHYGKGTHSLDRKTVGTRYVFVLLRVLADPADPADVEAANELLDAVRVEQARRGDWQDPHWDEVSRGKVREALTALDRVKGRAKGETFGTRKEVDPVLHLLGTAIGWGGNPRSAAEYVLVYPAKDDGKTPYELKVKDVPVDGFWSVSVYDKEGYFRKNERGLYSLNSLTAKRGEDGSYTIRFGGKPGATNWLPIVAGWNYTVRMYRPRKEILDGTWRFPEARPAE